MQGAVLKCFVCVATLWKQFLRCKTGIRWRHWNAWGRKWRSHVARIDLSAEPSRRSFLGFKYSRNTASLALYWNNIHEKSKLKILKILTNFWKMNIFYQVRSEDALFLDMKVGNLLQQNVIRVQTEQAHEISRIMRQYISMAQKSGQREWVKLRNLF